MGAEISFFLALFGITWGTLTVVLLLALGHGFYQKSQQDIMKIAEGTLYFAPGITSQSYRGMPTGRNVNIKAGAVLQLPTKFSDIQSTAPFLTQDATMTFQKNNLKKSVIGTTPLFQTFQKLDLIDGSRFLNIIDINRHEHVAIIGYNLKENLFNEHTALGREILIRNIPFKIVGVLQPPVRKKCVLGLIMPLSSLTRPILIYGAIKTLCLFLFYHNPTATQKSLNAMCEHI